MRAEERDPGGMVNAGTSRRLIILQGGGRGESTDMCSRRVASMCGYSGRKVRRECKAEAKGGCHGMSRQVVILKGSGGHHGIRRVWGERRKAQPKGDCYGVVGELHTEEGVGCDENGELPTGGW